MHSMPRSADPAAPQIQPARPLGRSLPWLLLAGGAIGLVAAFVLTIEKFTLAIDPTYSPSCSINPVLNCGSVMDTPQAAAFGFPNSLIGIAGFAVVTSIGAAMLAGAVFARWFWAATQFGITAAMIFVHWLIVQSVYEIGALCPYCMAVWAVTVPIFWYVTVRNLDLAVRSPGPRRWVDWLIRNHSIPVTVWFLALITLIAQRFWAYWSTLL